MLRYSIIVLIAYVTSPSLFALTFEDTIKLKSAEISLVIEDSDSFRLTPEQLIHWIKGSAQEIENYYGHFPTNHLLVALHPESGKGILRGKALGIGGASINIWIGRATDSQDLIDDWVLTHEMAHLAFPQLDESHEWLEEGLAVYVEAVARMHSGRLGKLEFWEYIVGGMPHGNPTPGDKGLDHTPTWGRTYWGGALFCLLADLRIQLNSQGKYSLQDALKGILNSGYNFLKQATIQEILSSADKTTKSTVLTELYQQHRATAIDVDLDSIWKNLGIITLRNEINLDENAQWAKIRRGIETP